MHFKALAAGSDADCAPGRCTRNGRRGRINAALCTEQRVDICAQRVLNAALCTLHAFAQRILVEHPIEAGLPPAVEIMDEVSSLVEFDERWAGVVDTLLGDPRQSFTMLVAFELGISLHRLRGIAHRLDDNWDLVEDRLAVTPDPRPIEVGPLLIGLREVVELRERCTAEADTMVDRLDRVEVFANRLEKANGDPLAVVRVLADRKDVSNRTRNGNKKTRNPTKLMQRTPRNSELRPKFFARLPRKGR